MQRRATKNTRAANRGEKQFHQWLKMQSCAVGGVGITEVHHCKGATFRHKKVLIGHWFCLPLSQSEHSAYHAGSKSWQEINGSQASIWLKAHNQYTEQTGCAAPIEVYEAIASLA